MHIRRQVPQSAHVITSNVYIRVCECRVHMLLALFAFVAMVLMHQLQVFEQMYLCTPYCCCDLCLEYERFRHFSGQNGNDVTLVRSRKEVYARF